MHRAASRADGSVRYQTFASFVSEQRTPTKSFCQLLRDAAVTSDADCRLQFPTLGRKAFVPLALDDARSSRGSKSDIYSRISFKGHGRKPNFGHVGGAIFTKQGPYQLSPRHDAGLGSPWAGGRDL